MPNTKTYVYRDGEYQRTNPRTCETTYSSFYKREKTFPVISEMNDTLEKTLSNRNVVVLEKICGRHFKVYFDGKDFSLGSEYNLLKSGDEYYGIQRIFNRYKSYFKKLSKELFTVPFTLFGEIVSKKTENEVCYLRPNSLSKLVFYDIFLNSNWMNWEDVKKILIKSNLLFTPELYTGRFNFQKIKICANGFSKFSSFKDQLIAGAIIRPALEDVYRADSYIDNRLIVKITSKRFVKKTKLLPSIFNKKNPANVAYKIILKYTGDDQTEPYWKSLLDKENILLVKSNLDEIIEIITKDTLSMLYEDIILESIDSEIDEKYIIDCLEKQLPWKIRNILNLND